MQVQTSFAMEKPELYERFYEDNWLEEADTSYLTPAQVQAIGLTIKERVDALISSVDALIELEKGTEQGKILQKIYGDLLDSFFALIRDQGRGYLEGFRGFSIIRKAALRMSINPRVQYFFSGEAKEKTEGRLFEIGSCGIQMVGGMAGLLVSLIEHIEPYIQKDVDAEFVKNHIVSFLEVDDEDNPGSKKAFYPWKCATPNKKITEDDHRKIHAHVLSHQIFEIFTDLENLLAKISYEELKTANETFSFRDRTKKIRKTLHVVYRTLKTTDRAKRSPKGKLNIIKTFAVMCKDAADIGNKIFECMKMGASEEEAAEEQEASQGYLSRATNFVVGQIWGRSTTSQAEAAEVQEDDEEVLVEKIIKEEVLATQQRGKGRKAAQAEEDDQEEQDDQKAKGKKAKQEPKKKAPKK